MAPDAVAALLGRLAPDLAALDEPWMLIGSAALLILGLSVEDCPDLDILTTEPVARRLETAWSAWRDADYAPDREAPFRSRFSRYQSIEGAWEVMGDLEVRAGDLWRPVLPVRTERRAFAGGAWPVPTPGEQLRILKLFGRPKDLEKATRLEAFLAG